MTELHFPWLEAAILIPLIGSLVVGRLREAHDARRLALWFAGAATVCAIGAWLDFSTLQVAHAHDRWDFVETIFGHDYLTVDELSAPLLPLVAVLYFLTAVSTLKTKLKRFSFSSMLMSQAINIATFAWTEPWGLIVLLGLGAVPPYLELRARRRPTRVFVIHMALFVGLMVLGESLVVREDPNSLHSMWGLVPLLVAICIRNGIAPLHCWMTDLFEHATFGTSLLFATPMVGGYATVRLVFPVAPHDLLHTVGLFALITAVYAAAMAIVQREVRRYFCYLFISHSALVLVGLEMLTPLGLTGALCVWLSIGLSLGAFGLTLRALEARCGRLTLTEFHGLYEHTPALAVCFVLTGLASIGFPGSFGFVGIEILLDAAVDAYPLVGAAVVVASALNGIALLKAYFMLFTGTRYQSSVRLALGRRESFGVLALAAVILVGGLWPQPGVASRHHAAIELLHERAAILPPPAVEGESESIHQPKASAKANGP